MDKLPVTTNYEEHFDPYCYLEAYYDMNSEETGTGGRLAFSIDCLHEAFNSGQITGGMLLDVGTGPTVHSVISASRHVTEIHLSDIVSRNRDILQKWLEGEINVTKVFEYVLEKENDGTTLEDRMNMVRQRVTQIYPIDLRLEKPLQSASCEYDVIITSLSFNSAARNKTELMGIAQKIAEMLRKNGHLLIVGILRGTYYRVGNYRFPNHCHSREDYEDALGNAGFEIKVWKEMGEGGYSTVDKHKGFLDIDDFFFAVCEKI